MAALSIWAVTREATTRSSVKIFYGGGFPIKFAETPCELRLPAPEIGADTEAVLRGLGYSTELATLRARGIV